MNTKGGKWIETYFFPIDPFLQQVVLDWVRFLQTEKLFGPTDALFPKSLRGQDANQQFSVVGIDREHWQSAQAVRDIFRAAFEATGLPYYHPHSLRHTLGHIGQQVCKTPEQMKAWSQNLGHEGVLTTLTSYGHMTHHRQGEVIRGIGHAKPDEGMVRALAEAVLGIAGRAS